MFNIFPGINEMYREGRAVFFILNIGISMMTWGSRSYNVVLDSS